MYQIAPQLWNEIARTEAIRSPTLRAMMAVPPERMLEALAGQEKALEAAGTPAAVITSYMTMAPLLCESRAISRYIARTESFGLRDALPEVLTAKEAVAMAALDRSMTSTEQKSLLTMLLPLEPTD